MDTHTIHLRIDSRIVYGIDALAVAWHTTRNGAAARLLDEGVREHLADAMGVIQSLVNKYHPIDTSARLAEREGE